MACNDSLIIDIVAAAADGKPRRYELADAFFQGLDQESITAGRLEVEVRVRRDGSDVYHLHYTAHGAVTVPCDRCLEDLSLPVGVEDEALVSPYVDDNDDREEVYALPVGQQEFDLGWDLYEAVELSLPLKRVHRDGECDPDMVNRLAGVVDDGSETDADGL